MSWLRPSGKTLTLFLLMACVGLAATPIWRGQIAFEFGYAYAQGNFHGLLLSRDDAKAAYWLRLAATENHPRAQYMLGLLHAHGWGVKQDDALAEQWFNLAAHQDYAPAAFHLAWMYHKGEGVAADMKRSLRLMQLATDQDMAAAQLALGRFYESGEGVTKDTVLAMQWYRRAADTARRRPERFDNAHFATQASAARDRLARQIVQQNAAQTQVRR
jgi:TPR repeat protein